MSKHAYLQASEPLSLFARFCGACGCVLLGAGAASLVMAVLPPCVTVRVLACLGARDLGLAASVSRSWCASMPAVVFSSALAASRLRLQAPCSDETWL